LKKSVAWGRNREHNRIELSRERNRTGQKWVFQQPASAQTRSKDSPAILTEAFPLRGDTSADGWLSNDSCGGGLFSLDVNVAFKPLKTMRKRRILGNVAPREGMLLSRRGDKKGKLSLRSRVACGGWTMILAVLLVSVIAFSETEVQMLLMLSMAYGLQGWLAELIGVKIDASGVLFPNRMFPQFQYLVLFRGKLSKGSIDRIDFVRKRSLVIHSAGERVTVHITTRLNGIAVAKHLRNEFPKVLITLLY
jgi:hypothetical protein